jgi:hypothetical protein
MVRWGGIHLKAPTARVFAPLSWPVYSTATPGDDHAAGH